MQLAARGVTAADVLAAISNSNFLAAPGRTENEFVAYNIQHADDAADAGGVRGAAAPRRGRRRSCACATWRRIELASEEPEEIVTFNGQPGTFIGVFPTPAANPLSTAAAVVDELPAINASLPEGMTIELVYDSTETISASIEEVFKTIAEAVAIVVLVILLFLGSFRSVLMPVVTIPLSLIGVCSVLLALGYSLNLLSLLAMVLAIGLVVDDAIVVVENIHRHIEEGLTPLDASIVGMKEITGPVIAMTLTLAAVLSPLGFTGGLTGALFREFAFALAGAVIISGVVALTITPTMAARLLKSGEGSRFQRIVDRTFDRVANWYERRVSSSLDYRPITILMVLALLGATGFMFTRTTTELAPGGGPGRALRDPERPALRDARLHPPLHRADPAAHRRHPRGHHRVLHRGLRPPAQLRVLHLGVQGLGRARPVAGGAAAGAAGPPRQGRRRRGLRLLAADAAGGGRRPADHRRHPVDPRPGAGLRGRRARCARRRRRPAASSWCRTRSPSTRRR